MTLVCGVLGISVFLRILELWVGMQAGDGKAVHSFGLVLRFVRQDRVAQSPGPAVVCPC